MDITKSEEISKLFDIYSCLLTEHQVKVFSMYYFDDLSLGEIATDMEVSRNAILDLLKRVEATLLDYESKLKLYSKREKIQKIANKVDIKEVKDILNILDK